jgi:hypothetical protein
MDESQDPKPHPLVHSAANPAEDAIAPKRRNELSIWFFCGILMLVYGLVLVGTGIYEANGHQPDTVLARLQPTLWWGVVLTLFGGFFAVNWRPGKV